MLVYAQQRVPGRSDISRGILDALPGLDVVFVIQVMAEFLKVVRQKNAAELGTAMEEVSLWSLAFPCAATEPADLVAAARLAERHKLQFWDSLILTVAGGVGVTLMLSEDMQDGATYGGVKVLDPFNPANRPILDDLLTPASGTA